MLTDEDRKEIAALASGVLNNLTDTKRRFNRLLDTLEKNGTITNSERNNI